MDSSSDSSRSSSGGDIDLDQLVRDLHVIAPPQAPPSPTPSPETDGDDIDHELDDKIAADESVMSEVVSWVASLLALESDKFYTRKVGCTEIDEDTTMDMGNGNWSEVNATTLGTVLASFGGPVTDGELFDDDEANSAARLDAIMDDRLSMENETLALWTINPRSPYPDSGSLIELVHDGDRRQVLVWPPLTDSEVSVMTANSGSPAKQVKLENFAVQLLLGVV